MENIEEWILIHLQELLLHIQSMQQTPTALTHHSTVTIPETAKQAVFLNDTKTLLGVFGVDAFYIYNWDNTNGWTLTTTLAEKAFAVGRDSTDRIWMVAGGRDNGYADIHVITPTIPVRITITPAQPHLIIILVPILTVQLM